MQSTILVVEDDPHIRSNIVQLLTFEGYDVTEAADGYEGLQKAISNKPSLILCDVTMPKMDGFALLNEIRHTPPISDTAFIFITARSARQDMRHAMSRGADDYVTKPFSDSELLDAVSARLIRLCDTVDTTDNEVPTANEIANVLIVQESPYVIKFIERAIESVKPGYHLFIVRTMAELVRQLDESRFAFAILDETWNDEKGMKAVLAVRESVFNRDIEIIMILESEKSPNLTKLQAQGVTNTLVRPLTVESLEYCIDIACRSDDSRARETVVRQTPRLVFSIIEDKEHFKPIENFMSARFNFVSYPSWPEAMKAMNNVIPEMLFYDVQPGANKSEWFTKLLDHNVRVVQIYEPGSAKDLDNENIVPLVKSPEIRNSLHVLVRDVFHYTGSFEYNVLEFLKEFLLNLFTEALKRQIQNHSLPTVSSVKQHAHTVTKDADQLISTIRFTLSDRSNEIAFVFNGNYGALRDLMIEANRGQSSDPVLAEVINYWNNSTKLIAMRLQRVLSLYGLEHEPPTTVTRVTIDQIKEDFHWYIESSLVLNANVHIGTKFGVSVLKDVS